jgi:hypothetical protein
VGFAGFWTSCQDFQGRFWKLRHFLQESYILGVFLLKRQSQGQVFMELDVLTRAGYSMFRWNCGLVRVLFLFQRQGYV